MAPAAGFEPATKWLTATYSTAELCRSVISRKRMVRNIHDFSFFASLKNTFFENKSENLNTNDKNYKKFTQR